MMYLTNRSTISANSQRHNYRCAMRRNSKNMNLIQTKYSSFFAMLFSIFQITRLKYHTKKLVMRKKLIRSYCICPWQYKIAFLQWIFQCLVLNDQRERCYWSTVKEKYFYWNKRKSCNFVFNIVFPLLSLILYFPSSLTFQNICIAFDWHISKVNSFHLTLLPDERIQ